MITAIATQPLTRQAFAAYGDVIEKQGANHHLINDGNCIRFHDLAGVQLLGEQARALINIFSPQPKTLPCPIALVERHPLGSQAFIPLTTDPFVVVVCRDTGGIPVEPRAFITNGTQGVNYRANVWHAPLLALAPDTNFAVIDRDGDGINLEEFHFPEPLMLSYST